MLTVAPHLSAASGADNPIVRENKNAGTTDWLLTKLEPAQGNGEDEPWQRRAGIEGFCSHPSMRPGESRRVYVSTNPASEYHADIYRLGYYGGQGGRHLRRIGPLAGKVQPTPTDAAKQLVQCQWTASFELEIPRDWLSGV